MEQAQFSASLIRWMWQTLPHGKQPLDRMQEVLNQTRNITTQQTQHLICIYTLPMQR